MMKIRSFLLLTCFLSLGAGVFAHNPGGKQPTSPGTKKYIDVANMDLSVRPGDNFYQYANGQWLKKNPIPASKTRWGSFDELREESSKRLQTLLEDAVKNRGRDRKTQIIGEFYASGMDSSAIEAR